MKYIAFAIALATVTGSITEASAAQKEKHTKPTAVAAKVKVEAEAPPAPIEPKGSYENDSIGLFVTEDQQGIDESELMASLSSKKPGESCYTITTGSYSEENKTFKSHPSESDCRVKVQFTADSAKIIKSSPSCKTVCKTSVDLDNAGELKKTP